MTINLLFLVRVRSQTRFAKLPKVTTAFAMCLSVYPYVRPSARMEQLGFHWTDFREV